MDIIVKANHTEFEEAKGDMCKALEELMADVCHKNKYKIYLSLKCDTRITLLF